MDGPVNAITDSDHCCVCPLFRRISASIISVIPSAARNLRSMRDDRASKTYGDDHPVTYSPSGALTIDGALGFLTDVRNDRVGMVRNDKVG